MPRSGPYFRTIQTTSPKEDQAAREHAQKLENYLYYDWPTPGVPAGKPKLSYKREIKQMNTTSCVKNEWFIITTVLCCEDEYGEDADDKS